MARQYQCVSQDGCAARLQQDLVCRAFLEISQVASEAIATRCARDPSPWRVTSCGLSQIQLAAY